MIRQKKYLNNLETARQNENQDKDNQGQPNNIGFLSRNLREDTSQLKFLQREDQEIPLTIAAGCYGVDGYGTNFNPVFWEILAGATFKTTTRQPIDPPEINHDFLELRPGLYWNNIRLRNPGIENLTLDFIEGKDFRLSIYAEERSQWLELIEIAESLYPTIVGYELNLSCPNAEPASTPDLAEIKKQTSKPVYTKERYLPGADGVVYGNSVNGFSGTTLSNRYQEIKNYTVPVIGCGGVVSWDDYFNYVKAGAIEVQIGGYARSEFNQQEQG